MILTPKQFEEMLEAAKPLMKWLADNCRPHCEVRVDYANVVLLEEIAKNMTNEFIKD